MPVNVTELTGVERAAVLIMYLDRSVAKRILTHLDTEEIRQIGFAMAAIDQVDPKLIEEVVAEFIKDLSNASLMPRSGTEFIQSVLPDLLDDDRREEVVRSLSRRVDKQFEAFISRRSPKAVATVLKEELAQTRAAALCLMGSENAARVLRHFEETDQADLTIRMARMKQVPGEMADDICASLMQALSQADDRVAVGGVDRTARVLGHLQRQDNERLLTHLAERDETLATTLRQRMVVFDDLATLDDRGIQTLVKLVDREDLVRALKGAGPLIQERFFANMSSRAAEDLRESLDIVGTLRKAIVVEAQSRIVALAMELAEKGEIFFPLGEESEEGS